MNAKGAAFPIRIPARPAVAIIAFAASIALHAYGLLLYIAKYDIANDLSEVDMQFYFLLGVCLACAAASFLVDARWLCRLFLFLRLSAYLVLGYRFRLHVDLETALLLAALLETAFYEPFPHNLALQGAMIASATVVFGFVQADPGLRLAPEPADLLQLTMCGAAAGAPASLLTYYREKMLRVEGHAARMDGAVAELSQSNIHLQQLLLDAVERTKTAERDRITGEIHDTVGYTLTNLIMMMEAAADLSLSDTGELERTMQAARDLAKEGLAETRKALYALKDQKEMPLTGLRAVQRIIDTFRKVSSVRVRVEYGNSPMSFGEERDGILYHFVQEGLTNALRHGRADGIRILFWIEKGMLTASIRDNGIGAADLVEGIGMRGMRARLAAVGGVLEARNVLGGFEITARMPVEGGDG